MIVFKSHRKNATRPDWGSCAGPRAKAVDRHQHVLQEAKGRFQERRTTFVDTTLVVFRKHLGSISPGKFADIVLLNANPLENIRDTGRIELLIRGGRAAGLRSC